ncbi:MAG: SUMF1/EgtB/PvdO family nonheme iron enzyme [Verrucomicrobia bacterium]|nr:SUMF1/EgtB/PvdO family nonheme iron enzyme [Verrucomicrobiota bacterium]
MKQTIRLPLGLAGLAVLAGVSLVTPALAATTTDPFGTGGNAFTMNFVDIGNPGNTNDNTGYGGVANSFRMSTYEVSEDMIDKANTAGVLGITLDTRGVDKPATSVTWNEAARFVNWLNVTSNSAPAYKFSIQPGGEGYKANANIDLWTVSDPGYNAANPFRNSNAKYFLPSENEWYKAAYYDPNKTGGAGYYIYPTGSDIPPTPVVSGTDSGTAVYDDGHIEGLLDPADITSAGGLSPYGTMGQGGNAMEWMETEFDGVNNSAGSSRGVRGGSYVYDTKMLDSSYRSFRVPTGQAIPVGFRVASLTAVPEPTSMLSTLALVSSGLLLRRRGKVSL